MIDLKKTLDRAGMKQSDLAKHFKIHKQQVNRWYKGGKLSKGWNLIFFTYFEARGKDIFAKE